MKHNTKKSVVIWLFIIGVLLFLFYPFENSGFNSGISRISYSKFIASAKNGDIKNVVVRNSSSRIDGKFRDEKVFTVVAPNNDSTMINTLVSNDVEVSVDPEDSGFGFFFSMFLPWLPMLLIIALLVYSSKQMQSGGRNGMNPLGMGKSKAKMMQDKKVNVTFADVAGIDEAKQELEEIVDFLKTPKKFQRLGGKIPRGVLLVGAPGNGKTLLAKAIAGEAGVPFFSISGSDFVEVFVGVGASRVRDMFEHAKKSAPCIVFIDEIDAVGRQRDSVMRGGNDEREQTLNQLLVEMDGFDESQGVIVLAATNRADVLDPALLRPGRFDRRITVQYPDMNGRTKILQVHTKNVPLSPDVDLRTIARGTPGFSGAELANLVNEAALLAARTNKLSVTMNDLEIAKDKVMMGAERKSMGMTEDEKKLTAYHEAGHALAAFLEPASDPIHKVTIIPRGGALGMVMRLPERDKISVTKAQLIADIKVAMGGRVAEEIIFGEDRITTGASSDISSATSIARKMITKWGMSNSLGFRTFFDGQSYGYIIDANDKVSEQTSESIDTEIKLLIDSCYKEIKHDLVQNKDKLETLAKALLVHETLSGDEVKKIINGETLIKQETDKTDNEFVLGGLPNNTVISDENTKK